MIWDCIIFGGELEVLEVRLKYLSSVRDLRFAICESNKTFSGKDKPYYLEENWDRFKPFHHRIDYIQIEQDPSQFEFRKVKHYDANNGPFLMEAQMRLGLSHINDKVKDDDVCVLSDVDEIWDVNTVWPLPLNPMSLEMNFYGYFFNNQNVEGPDIHWNGSVVCFGNYWKSTTPQALRDTRNTNVSVKEAGWHFSWIGDIKKKIQSFAHVEFDKPSIVNDEAISKAVENGGDVLQRPGVKYKFVPFTTFPEDLRAIILEYPWHTSYYRKIPTVDKITGECNLKFKPMILEEDCYL